MNKIINLILFIASIGFFSNVIWENAQAPLYLGYSDFWQHFPACFIATLGDVLVVLLIFGCFALIYRSVYWFSNMNVMKIILLMLSGAVISVAMEVFALNTGRWAYSDMMPTIAGIGVLPILQMMIILPLIFYITSKLFKK
jgi:hypothetical protein